MKIGPHILIFSAVSGELLHIHNLVENRVLLQKERRSFTFGHINGLPVKLIVTGPGIVNTVHGLTCALEEESPVMMIQTGCAGAFAESGLGLGDVGVASEERDIHLGIESQSGGLPHEDLPFSIIKKESADYKSVYPVNRELCELAFQSISFGMEKGIKVLKAPFVTTSTITATNRMAKDIYGAFAPCMESMEGVAAAHVALLYDIPFLEIRAASNMVGNRMRGKWDLPLAFERSARAVLVFLEANNNPSFFGDIFK